MTLIELSLPCETDTHLLVRFLMEVFSSKERIAALYKSSDYNPFLYPVFTKVIEKIFLLSHVSTKLVSEEGKNL